MRGGRDPILRGGGETPKNGEKVPFFGKIFELGGGASRPLRPLPAYGPEVGHNRSMKRCCPFKIYILLIQAIFNINIH